MRICVVGAGSIGGVIASGLAGVDGVTASVLARGATLDAIRADGLRVRLPDGSDRVVANLATAATDAAGELGVQDVVIVAVKAQSMGSVAASIGPLLGPGTSVLSTLNGVPWWFLDGFGGPAAGAHLDSVDPGGKIAAALPAARVIGGTVHLSAASPAPGVVALAGRERADHRRALRRVVAAADRAGGRAAGGRLRHHRLRPDQGRRLVQALGQPDPQPDLRDHRGDDRAGPRRRPGP